MPSTGQLPTQKGSIRPQKAREYQYLGRQELPMLQISETFVAEGGKAACAGVSTQGRAGSDSAKEMREVAYPGLKQAILHCGRGFESLSMAGGAAARYMY